MWKIQGGASDAISLDSPSPSGVIRKSRALSNIAPDSERNPTIADQYALTLTPRERTVAHPLACGYACADRAGVASERMASWRLPGRTGRAIHSIVG